MDGGPRRLAIHGDEFFSKATFHNPIVPASCSARCSPRTAARCSHCGKMEGTGKTPLYTGLDKVRFKRVPSAWGHHRPRSPPDTRARLPLLAWRARHLSTVASTKASMSFARWTPRKRKRAVAALCLRRSSLPTVARSPCASFAPARRWAQTVAVFFYRRRRVPSRADRRRGLVYRGPRPADSYLKHGRHYHGGR